MKTDSLALLTMCVLYFIPPSHGQGAGGPELYMYLFQLKKFGTECVLKDECSKGNSKELVEKLSDIDKNLLTCFERVRRSHLSRLREDEDERENQGTIKDRKNVLAKTVKRECKNLNELTECLQPLQDTFRECKHTAGIAAFALAKEICKENGNPTLEFMIEAERCTEPELKNPRAFQECLDKSFNSKTKDFFDYISKNTCKAASDFKECCIVYFDQCKYTEPKKILEKYLNELKKKSPEANQCFFQDNNQQDRQKLSEPTSTAKPTKGSGNRKNSRPKYVW